MTAQAETLATLPHPAPTAKTARLMLYAMRRMAAGGLDDAHAANALIGTFGLSHRRILMFVRIFMEEVSRISERSIRIAPCCCPRMTEGEAMLLQAVESARENPAGSRRALACITGSLDCLAAVSVARALGDALADLGRPLMLQER